MVKKMPCENFKVTNSKNNHDENNGLLTNFLISGNEGNFKSIKKQVENDFLFWLDIRNCIPDHYFVQDQSSMLNGKNDLIENGKTFVNGKSKMTVTNNLEGYKGLKGSKKNNMVARSDMKKPFPTTLEELEKEFEEFKGKPLSYHDKLRKKGLYSRIIKKKRKEERTKLKTDDKNNRIKMKPIKNILNNEGKVVSSKFDFTESKRSISKEPKSLKNNHNETNKITSVDGSSKNNTNLNNKLNSKQQKFEIKEDLSETTECKTNDLKQSFGPVFNKESKMVFSKFEFSTNKNKKIKKNDDKNPMKILNKIKEKEVTLKELEESGSRDKALEIKEKEKWALTLKKASGEKVKDDPELLKKSVKREKHKKLRSKKKWDARMTEVKKSQQEKQQKRLDNIKTRKVEKKKKKIKKAIKKGRYIPF